MSSFLNSNPLLTNGLLSNEPLTSASVGLPTPAGAEQSAEASVDASTTAVLEGKIDSSIAELSDEELLSRNASNVLSLAQSIFQTPEVMPGFIPMKNEKGIAVVLSDLLTLISAILKETTAD